MRRAGSASAVVTYGWGMIPVAAQIGATGWTTSLFPKDGRHIVVGVAGHPRPWAGTDVDAGTSGRPGERNPRPSSVTTATW